MPAWLWPVLACGIGATPTPERCAAMGAGERRDACYAAVAVEMFQSDPASAAERIAADVGQARVRDFIYLTVTREVDPSSKKYCDRIETPAIAERCNIMVHRPHLHRALIESRKSAENGASSKRAPPEPASPQKMEETLRR
jgi:hypothetical protein